MLVRLLAFMFLLFAVSGCAQTGKTIHQNKYEKSLVLIERIITPAFIDTALAQSMDDYRKEYKFSTERLSDETLDKLTAVLSREINKTRRDLVVQLATVFTQEFTTAEINALYSIEDFDLLSRALSKLQEHENSADAFKHLTPEELKALLSLKDPKALAGAAEKIDKVVARADKISNDYVQDIIVRSLPEIFQILQDNETLVGA
ncbi:hypothetical protein O4H49_06055 [Kiloniella laminariae]|uniref:DUF2059 domain-containing protein n=1 Tax=Kiloniella laminariae TaxID=454162 RepID=A0ABT4LGV4_9PROT|nr:hypothetical protein [Kiloniella laminariae]MCZ4280330.1 hypothetical protein [Kiloniella laminariae]